MRQTNPGSWEKEPFIKAVLVMVVALSVIVEVGLACAIVKLGEMREAHAETDREFRAGMARIDRARELAAAGTER